MSMDHPYDHDGGDDDLGPYAALLLGSPVHVCRAHECRRAHEIHRLMFSPLMFRFDYSPVGCHSDALANMEAAK